jgi:5-methyltetrahydrofolate--homocysteine methyltransferase
MIRTLSFDAPAWDKREIMRYARIRGANNSYDSLIDDCIRESEPLLTYRLCYTVLQVEPDGSIMIGNERVASQTIGKAIRDSKQVILFAATVGAPFDRLIARYSRVEPSKALILQAIGAERVESLCDAFCDQMNTELNDTGKRLTRRVSPGYGDIPLRLQKEIFAVLDCPRKIGLTLDQSLLMSPSKSVTAIAGVTDECEEQADKCAACNKTDCAYRK